MDKVKVLPPDLNDQYQKTAAELLAWIQTELNMGKENVGFATALHDGTLLCQLALRYRQG
jgi:hypothetical protein